MPPFPNFGELQSYFQSMMSQMDPSAMQAGGGWNPEAAAMQALFKFGMPGGGLGWTIGGTTPEALEFLKAMGITNNPSLNNLNGGAIDFTQAARGGSPAATEGLFGVFPPGTAIGGTAFGGGNPGTTTGGGGGGGGSYFSGDLEGMNTIFDQQMWLGPYAAPLTGLQLDAMEGFGQFMNQNPILQQSNIQSAIGRALGDPLMHPNVGKTNLTGALDPVQSTINMTMPAFSAALNPQGFDTTQMFKAGEQVFQDDLSRTIADLNEQFSAMGLDPGATDRTDRILRTVGNETARFRLGQQDIARQAFEDKSNRGLAALGMAPNMAGLGTTFGDLLRVPFSEDIAGESLRLQDARANQANIASLIPTLMDIFNQPANLALQGFQMGSGAQNAADTAINRMISEYARSSGGGLNQAIALMSGIPLNEVGYGPSQMSQWASGLGGLLQGAGSLYSSGIFGGGQRPGVAPQYWDPRLGTDMYGPF